MTFAIFSTPYRCNARRVWPRGLVGHVACLITCTAISVQCEAGLDLLIAHGCSIEYWQQPQVFRHDREPGVERLVIGESAPFGHAHMPSATHVTMCHMTVCHVTMCYVTMCQVTMCHVTMCHMTVCHVIMCHVTMST